ncbi:MAG: hypothetical protein ACP5KV_02560 [Candidatus Methanomethylicaceae archaeon]
MSCCALVVGKDEIGAFVASTFFTPIIVYAVKSLVRDLRKIGAGKEDFLRLVALMVLGKGTIYKNECVRFYSKQSMLCGLFAELTYTAVGVRAHITYLKERNCFAVQIYHKELAESLFKLSPTYSTRSNTPPYPTVRYLHDMDGDLKIFALRLLFSINGTALPIFQKTKDLFYLKPYLGVGYLSPHPLLMEYKSLLEEAGMRFILFQDLRYPDKGYLATYSWSTAERFVELGGFLDGVLFLRGAFKGVEKNVLLWRLISLRRKGKTVFPLEEIDDLKRKLSQKPLFRIGLRGL